VVNFILPPSYEVEELLGKINQVFSYIPEPPEEKNYQYFDTFDWRLFQNKLQLSLHEKKLLLKNSDRETLATPPVEISSEAPPAFWWDFPDSQLKDKLEPVIKIRALMLLFHCCRKSRQFRILNNDEKTVVRLAVNNIQVKDKEKSATLRLLTLSPLRGYDSELAKITGLFGLSDLGETKESQFELSLKALGRTPGSYSSKLDIKLHPQMTSLQATRKIFQHLLRTMRGNEPGLKADIDTEFLHDFRVAIRRTRSALAQIKGVLPDRLVERFKKDFAYIQRATNSVRDLDVYLLNESQYKQMVPESIQSGLDDFFDHLKKQRTTEFKKMLRTLNSKRYAAIMNTWQELLEDDDESFPEMENSFKPVARLSKTLIMKRYKKIIKASERITPETQDKTLHELRIDCKKLRYLLEFFASLYPEKEIDYLVKQLKKLQDNLGDFNDFSVQQKNLNVYLEKFRNYTKTRAETLAAMGGLITVLNEKKSSLPNCSKSGKVLENYCALQH